VRIVVTYGAVGNRYSSPNPAEKLCKKANVIIGYQATLHIQRCIATYTCHVNPGDVSRDGAVSNRPLNLTRFTGQEEPNVVTDQRKPIQRD
jgi:hypothetical protein